MELTGWIKYAAKAVYASVTTFLMELLTALANDGTVTQTEWLVIILGVVIVTGGVFGLTNSDEKP